MAQKISVDIVADLVCPWCWLGKRNWDAARALVPGVEVETLWRPYQLDPTLPHEGKPYQDYMRVKFAGTDQGRWKAMRDHLEQAAPAAGIEFRFDDIPRRPNTMNAHRLMRWSVGPGVTDIVAEALFKAYFQDCRDIGDTDVLVSIAEEAGMDGDLVRELLGTERDARSVWDEEVFFRQLGVSGVPTYIFNGRFAVSGAQGPEALADAIRQAVREPAETE